MDTRKVYEVPSWINSGDLADLIDQLKEAGYNIGVSQYITAQKLILALLDQEKALDLPENLSSLLGPIFCSSPTEQEEFPNQFSAWIESLRHTNQLPVEAHQKIFEPEDLTDIKAKALSKELKNIGSSTRRLKRVFLTAIAIICLPILFRKSLHSTFTQTKQVIAPKSSVSPKLSALPKSSILPTPTISQEITIRTNSRPFFFRWQLVLIAFLMLPTVVFSLLVIWRLWWFRRAHLFLQRLGVMREPELQKVSIREFEHYWFPRILLTHIARQLKRRVHISSNELDETKTIDATLRQGGWFSPVYHTYQTPVEYLFLINRASFRDHQARWVDEMIDFLKRDGVFVAKYYFEANPLICFGDTVESPPKKLSEIKNQYNQHCLVIVSDAHIFFSAIDGELVPWITQFEAWAKRTILTPSPIGNWVSHEFILAQQFIVLPATAQGLYILSQILNPDTANTYIVSEEDKEPLPDPLLTRPLRWIERDPPAPDQVEAMLKLIQQYLGKAGFYWFCACAVFPELHWNITLYLGNVLNTIEEEPLVEHCEPARLARLPWFRYAYMPDWLRMRLILALTTTPQSEIRSALQDLLITSVQGSVNKQQLEIAQNYHQFLPELVNPILRRLSQMCSKGSPFQDYLFLRFMNGQPLLASKVPEEFRYVLKRRNPFVFFSQKSFWVLWITGGVAVLGLLGGAIWWGTSQIKIQSEKPADKMARDAYPCCIQKLDFPEGSFSYGSESNGLWHYILRHPGLVSLGKTLEEDLARRVPKFKLKYKPENSLDSSLAKLRDGDLDFVVTTLPINVAARSAIDSEFEVQVIAHDGIAVFVSFSDVHRDRNLARSLQGMITFEQLRKLYTGKIKNWQEMGGPDLKVKLYAPTDPKLLQIFETQIFAGDEDALAQFRQLQDSSIIRADATQTLRDILNDFEEKDTGSIGFDSLSKVFGQCSVYPLGVSGDRSEGVQALVQDNGKPITPRSDLCDDKGSYWLNSEAFTQTNYYPLKYDLVVVYPKGGNSASPGKKFTDLWRTEEGQGLLSAAGLVSILPVKKN
jgi:hypothetical protein